MVKVNDEMMSRVIHIQNVSRMRIPSHCLLKAAATLVLSDVRKTNKMESGVLCIRMVDEVESAMLNRQYRKKNRSTNVLAFPMGKNKLGLLGDLVICTAVVKREALSQDKTLAAHFSHMIIHGTLHLLGFDHKTKEEALKMESLEIKFLRQLGFANPYILKHSI